MAEKWSHLAEYWEKFIERCAVRSAIKFWTWMSGHCLEFRPQKWMLQGNIAWEPGEDGETWTDLPGYPGCVIGRCSVQFVVKFWTIPPDVLVENGDPLHIASHPVLLTVFRFNFACFFSGSGPCFFCEFSMENRRPMAFACLVVLCRRCGPCILQLPPKIFTFCLGNEGFGDDFSANFSG